MYTRSYTENPPLTLPEGYAGTMLDGDAVSDNASAEQTAEAAAPASGILSGLGGIGSLFNIKHLGEFKIGTEELLIAAVALFLLFSKNGDKECAIMLLLTLFVSK